MSKFKPGIRVVIEEDNSTEVKNGTVKSVFEELSTAIVEIDEGECEKIPFDKMSIPQRVEETPDDTPRQPVEKTEVTITPEEFKRITTEIVVKESLEGGPIISICGALLCAKIHKALFCND